MTTRANPLDSPGRTDSDVDTNSSPHQPESSIDGLSRILVIDHDERNMLVTTAALRESSFRNIASTTDPITAIDLMHRDRPDLVLLELTLPGVNGLTILKRMRNDPLLQPIPVIILTASTDRRMHLQTINAGVTDFLAKPIQPAALVQRVRDALHADTKDDTMNSKSTAAGRPEFANRVYVVEDNEVVRLSLHRLLDASGYDVRSFACAEDLLEQLDDLPGGCVVSDRMMPGRSGLDLQKELAKRWDKFRMILISAYNETNVTVKALQSGVVDVLDKPVCFESLSGSIGRALTSLRSGKSTRLDPSESVAPGSLSRARRSTLIAGFTAAQLRMLRIRYDSLSGREQQVAEQMFEGCTNRSIAITLGIAQKTVEKHRANVMKKLSFRSVAEFARAITALQEFDRAA